MLSNKNYYNICTEITLLKTIQYSSLPIPVQRLLTENDINQNIFDECKTIYYKNVMMMRQSVFVERLVDVGEEPCFVSILYFLKIQNIWKAVVEHLQVVGFNETLWAYEIEFCKTLDLLDLDQLLHILLHGLDIYYVQGSAYVNVLSQEEIDGATLARLPYDEVCILFPKLKDRILFTEKRDLLIKQCNNIVNEQLDDGDILNQSSKQTFDTCTTSQAITSTQDLLNNPSLSSNSMNSDAFDAASNIDDEVNHDETDDLEEPQQNLPTDFAFSSLPEEIQVIIDENELMKLRGHTNHRRILLNFVFKAVATTYNLLYPKANDYFLITQALLKALNISTTDANAAIYVSTIMDESDVEQLIITMNEGIENETIHNDELITLWKKRLVIMFEEVKMIENIDIEQNVNEILPRLFDKLPNNSLFVMGEITTVGSEQQKNLYSYFIFSLCLDLLPIRVIKLLCKQFNQSISHILVDNEPIVPAPCIKVTNEKFELYLDWNLIIRTTSPTTALALLLSLYNVFAIKFAKNNHTSHLLYAVFFQNGDELGKNLGITLNSWYFTFEDRVKHSQIQATNVIDSVNMPSTSNLQVHSTSATTTEIIQSSIILNNKENQSPISPQSIPLIIDEQEEQQQSDNPLMQEHEPEQTDIAIETPSISSISSRIKAKSNTKTKSRTSSNSQNAALRDATNKEETSTALAKNKKRKLPPSPPQQQQRKQSSRLIAKRSRQDDSPF
ncbi:unnamed protein product [Adineta steineri]|uniref:Uncharacterized protein n=1 Tax=Adineta steineri TaxID=433720 RepID=A0A815PTS5_9BILA|nr:unnamed protein product [Adineta steineri]